MNRNTDTRLNQDRMRDCAQEDKERTPAIVVGERKWKNCFNFFNMQKMHHFTTN